ncbi:family 20 glycosylhydrolase [Streptomyces sp. NPDC047017]|uniref:family 20 glycosylhydrolase n=1 Tax=Streptomyces sp. NPDC047017 TaxID=3155024 RepID=UPI0033D040AB
MHVIPAIAAATAASTGGLPVDGPWRITADPSLQQVADVLRDLLAPHLGDRIAPPGGAGRTLRLTRQSPPPPARQAVGTAPTGAAEPPDESYEVTVDEGGITCRARTGAGAFRAATTAAQMLLTTPPGGMLAHRRVRDAPHFAWRGLMLDPARTFLAPADLRRLIDVAALYKFNVLHLHLTDNEGWRLEVPPLPQLTGRHESSSRHHYTVDDYAALQEYAALRHLTLVPEIDLPGHCAPLRAVVPGLPGSPAPPGLTGRFPFVSPLDLTDPATRDTVAAVLADVCARTRGPFVHIGGDEAFGVTHENFAASVGVLRALVRESGKIPIAWQEASRAGVEPGEVFQHWVDVPMMDLPDTAEALAGRPELTAAGFSVELIAALKGFFAPCDRDVARVLAGGGRVLLSPQSHLYLDRPYAADITPPAAVPRRTPLGFPGYRPRGVEHTASWDPAQHGVPDERIAGVEATLFAERLGGFDDVSTLLLPRLPSVAEAAWNGRAPHWPAHRRRLGAHARWWRQRALAFFPATDVPWR